MKYTFILVLVLVSSSLPLAFSASQVTITQSSGQTESPLIVKDNSGTILFQVLNDGKTLVNQFIKFSQSGLSTIKTYVFPNSNGIIVLQNTTDTFTGTKTFGTTTSIGRLAVAGATSGSTIINATAVAGSGFVTLPTTGTLATLAGTETLSGKNLTNPTITGLKIAVTSQSADYTALSTDAVILVDATSATRILTLPAAASNVGKLFYIKSIGTPGVNVVLVDGNGAETIDGFANFNMTMADEVAVIQSDGTNWNRLDGNVVIPLAAGTTLNRWHGSAINELAPVSATPLASTFTASPFIVNSNITIDKIQAIITIASSDPANTCRMGIYRDNGNAYPGALVSGSDVATFTQTAALKTNTFVSPIKLTKGLYWLSHTCNAATTAPIVQPQFRVVQAGAIPSVLGFTDTMPATSSTGWTISSFTYPAALPGTFPSGATINTGSVVQILVRITG